MAGHAEIVKFLLSKGANVDAVAPNGMTALIAASNQGSVEISKMLVNHKANINATLDNGKTALDIALQHNNTDIADFLRSKGGKSGKTVIIR